VDLFGLGRAVTAPAGDPAATRRACTGFQPDWSEAIRLAGERETLGLYLTGHPINRYERDLKPIVSGRIADLISDRPPRCTARSGAGRPGKPATVAGYVHELRKRGRASSAILDDRTGRHRGHVLRRRVPAVSATWCQGRAGGVEGSLRFDEFSDGWRLPPKRVVELDRLREQQAQRIVLPGRAARSRGARASCWPSCSRLARPGACAVAVRYAGERPARRSSSGRTGACAVAWPAGELERAGRGRTGSGWSTGRRPGRRARATG
jgi:DNA polymerase III alpha subunit